MRQPEKVRKFQWEATSGDYDHLLATINAYFRRPAVRSDNSGRHPRQQPWSARQGVRAGGDDQPLWHAVIDVLNNLGALVGFLVDHEHTTWIVSVSMK
jgi:hypothetical protein